jgi:hypothetical protein
MKKALVASSMFFGLMLAASVPVMAQVVPPPEEDPTCRIGNPCGPSPSGNGADVSNLGVNVHTPNGSVFIDQATTPPTVCDTFDGELFECLGF